MARRPRAVRARAVALAVVVCVTAFLAGGAIMFLADRGTGAGDVRDEVRQTMDDAYYRDVDPAVLDAALASPGMAALPVALGDPYTRYLSPQQYADWNRADAGRYVGVGVVLCADGTDVEITQVVDGSPARQAGLRAHDVVVAVDDRPTAGLPVDAVLDRVRGPAGSTVALTVRHGADPSAPVTRTAPLPRVDVAADSVVTTVAPVGRHRAGVIALGAFDEGSGERVRAATAGLARDGADVLVLDLRGDGGGLVSEARRVVSAFVPADTDVFRESGAHVEDSTWATDEPPVVAASVPLVVLVDHDSASASELTASALRDAHRARIAGAPTFGKGVIQDVRPLRDGGALKLTIAEYRSPAGEVIDHRGVVPDLPLAAAPAPASGDPAVAAAVTAVTDIRAYP